VEILGLSGVPAAGVEVTVVRVEKKAREVALYRSDDIFQPLLQRIHRTWNRQLTCRGRITGQAWIPKPS
jgi:hypothetical protein